MVLVPIHAAALLTGAASFRDNPLIGSTALNRRGLHLWRVRTAERMAARRRRALAGLISPAHREEFEAQGYVVIRDALPPEAFAALRREAETTPFPATEMKQGVAVTRFATMPPERLRAAPALRAFLRGPLFQGLMRYVGAADADPTTNLHTVHSGREAGRPDPQTQLHSDTFHATAKAWLFLDDVAEEDGPFSYVPGSHCSTPGRLAWERAQSLEAASHRNGHHALGSFRAKPAEVLAMGYPAAVSFPAPANTFVIADTRGFHARRPSLRPSRRVAVYGSLRGGPFLPFAAPGPFDLPFLRGRRAQAVDFQRAVNARLFGRGGGQKPVGEKTAYDPPSL